MFKNKKHSINIKRLGKTAQRKISLGKMIGQKKREIEAMEKDPGLKHINISKGIWREKPVSPEEYIYGKKFLASSEGEIYPKITENLQVLFSGEDYMPIAEIVLMCAGFGSGKSTWAGLAESYFFYWNTCLKNIKGFYGHKKTATYTFMNIAPTSDQAKKIIFSEIQNNIISCEWFVDAGFIIDPNIASKIKFKNFKDIEIVPGNSSKSISTGYNLLMGAVDECAADDCFVTKTEDLFFDIFQKLNVRRLSRFRQSPCKGLIVCTTTAGTEERTFEKMLFELEAKYKQDYGHLGDDIVKKRMWDTPMQMTDGKYLIRRDPVWEVNPKYDSEIKKKETFHIIVTKADRRGNKIIYEMDVPNSLEGEYKKNGSSFQRNQAAIPCSAVNRFFNDMVSRRYNKDRRDPLPNPLDQFTSALLPFYPNDAWEILLKSEDIKSDPKKVYYAHCDLSKLNDHVGFCVAHRGPDHMAENIVYPTVVIDLCVSFVSDGKKEIRISDVKNFILNVKNVLGFALAKITFDQYQSLQTIQDFESLGMLAEREPCSKASFISLKELWYSDPCRLDIFYDAQLWWEVERLEDKGRVVEKSTGATDDEVECLARAVEEAMAGEMPKNIKPRSVRGFIGQGRYSNNGINTGSNSGYVGDMNT